MTLATLKNYDDASKSRKNKENFKNQQKKTYKRKHFRSKAISLVSSLFYSVLALLSQLEASLKNWRIFPSGNHK